MPGRYGVSSPLASRHLARPLRRLRPVRAALLGCSTVVAAGLFGLSGTAIAPTVPDDAAALPYQDERAAGTASRSDDRMIVGKLVGSAAPKAPARPAGAAELAGTPKPGAGAAAGASRPTGTATAAPRPRPNVKPPATAPLPARSGTGHRVVFDITAQQVWLVDDANKVVRTYKVSGSRFDQLPAGSYEVFSASRHATSWHGTETMEYMVRFYRGENSNIGFHDIPVTTATGEEVQTLSQLGTPLSDGCVRQDVTDAVALWEHAPVGTSIVVVRT